MSGCAPRMGLFSRKPASYLGVDIGGGGVKVVEFRNDKHRARLSTYGFADTPSIVAGPVSAANVGGDTAETAAVLRSVCAQAKVEARRVVAGLPIAAVFSSIITLPRMPKKELTTAVTWEAKKILPLPVEEMVIDWKLLTPEDDLAKKTDAAKVMRVLMTGAPKELVSRYVGMFKDAGLELVSLETEAFALIRSLVGSDPSVVLILDIGATRTSMVIAAEGTPVFSRSIDVGGRHFTQAIAGALRLEPLDAEQLKLDLAVLPGGSAASAALPEIIRTTLAPVIQEVRYGVNLFLAQEAYRGRVVEKVILAGGAALLPSLPELLASDLGLRVFLGDPWARVIYPVDLRPALDAIGARFAVAAGLAMREIT